MGLAKKAVTLLVVMMGFCGLSMGAVYKVGDSAGWTNTAHFDYKAWAASKTFHVGDTILFKYNAQFQNVMRVTHKNFDACNATGAHFTGNTGNDTFHIRRRGHFYFICSLPGHCQAGQKVDIRVPRSSPAPTPAPQPPALPPVAASALPQPPAVRDSAPNVSPSRNDGASVTLVGRQLWLSAVVVAVSIFGFAY